MAQSSTDLTWLRGSSVLVTGARVSGLAVVQPLLDLGAVVTVTDSDRTALDEAANRGAAVVLQDELRARAQAVAEAAGPETSWLSPDPGEAGGGEPGRSGDSQGSGAAAQAAQEGLEFARRTQERPAAMRAVRWVG